MLLSMSDVKRLVGVAAPRAAVIAVLLAALTSGHAYAAKSGQEAFSSPGQAVKSMVEAMRTANIGRLVKIFGPGGRELFFSGDDAEDSQTREEFVKAYDEQNRLEAVGKQKTVLHVGTGDWPWPIPIVKTPRGWVFDTREGSEEILARRIGENELAAIQVCLAYVDAQREYAQEHREGTLAEYAQKLRSDPGKSNGLYSEGEQGSSSPMGSLVAAASREGMGGTAPQPYHGYYYKILKKQGKNAPGGAYDYVVDGKMIGGFALVAHPALYGASGIMTFIVNQDGVVYERNLGKATARAAEAMAAFEPGRLWRKVE